MLTTRSGRQALGWGLIPSALLTALLTIVIRSVSARVCTLMIDLDVVGCGRRMGRFVLPPGDPCNCTGVRLGGHYQRLAPEIQGQDPPLYMDMLPEVTAEVIGRWFNCTPADCQEILDAGQTTSGVYTIHHKGQKIQVYCRMESGKGYIVFQRRLDGSVSFNRTWQEYAEGFGDLTGEFWLGNQKLRSLNGNWEWELVITLRASDGDEARVRYGKFLVDLNNYRLFVWGYNGESGNPGNSLGHYRDGSADFSTRDADNDWQGWFSCAETFHGGWSYGYCSSELERCFRSNLNGLYYDNAAVAEPMQGIHWSTWKGKLVSLKGCEMMMRRSTPLPTDCQDILDAGQTTSGVYTIRREGQNMSVYCRMESEKGYTVFQRRQDGLVSFNQTWQEYAEGFGSLTGEFWLGNQKLYSLTGYGGWELVITLRAFDGDEARVRYGCFRIDSHKYKLNNIGSFSDESGVAGDSIGNLRYVSFSTRDADNDDDGKNCAEKFHGGWWFEACDKNSSRYLSNLNGLYYITTVPESMQGIQWSTWKGNRVSLKGCEMMTRRIP